MGDDLGEDDKVAMINELFTTGDDMELTALGKTRIGHGFALFTTTEGNWELYPYSPFSINLLPIYQGEGWKAVVFTDPEA